MILLSKSTYTHKILFQDMMLSKFNGWQKLKHTFSGMCLLPPFIHFRSIDVSMAFLGRCRYIANKNGLLFIITLLKNAKVALSRYLCKTPLNYCEGRVSLDRHGLPKILPWYLRKLILRDDYNSIILAYTLLSISRLFIIIGIPKYTSITDPFSGSLIVVNECKKFIYSIYGPLLRSLALKTNVRLRTSKLLPSSKVGPSGAPAAISITLEAISHNKGDFLDHLLKFCLYSGNTRLIEWLNYYTEKFSNIPLKTFNDTLSKLVELPEKEGKVRLIAIIDGWTQACLRPLHDYCFSIMEKLTCDFTYNQREALLYLKSRQESMIIQGYNPIFHCYDLTAATDRLPIVVQKEIITEIYENSLMGDSWSNLISNRDFSTKQGIMRYSVGQPMGAYSSFALLSLTHHMIVQFSAFRCGYLDIYKNYAIVGDDIVILDADVALGYLSIMKGLGLEINSIKSYVSTQFLEFCKRYWYKGIDVSPFPISLLLDGGSANEAEFHNQVVLRGYLELRTSNILWFNQKLWLTSPQPKTKVEDILIWMDLYGPSWLQSSCNHIYDNPYQSPYLKVFLIGVYSLLIKDLLEIITVEEDFIITYKVPKEWIWLKSIILKNKIDFSWLHQNLKQDVIGNDELRAKVLGGMNHLLENYSSQEALDSTFVSDTMNLTLVSRGEGIFLSGNKPPVITGISIPRLSQFWESLITQTE